MSAHQLRLAVLTALGTLAPGFAAAQDTTAGVEEITVIGEKLFRTRENTVEPLLSYQLDFFQQLEPISVGEMLKRVPGVAFTSDIGEYDAPQLRGLATQYTQVLINGRRIPGAGSDRSVFVDRIPSELVDHIEIIRSPTPNLDAQGVAGTLNIVLKDGASLQGGEVRASGNYYTEEDSALRGAATLSYGGRFEGGNYFLLGNVQERYAPKGKETLFFDDEREPDGTSFESDIRDSVDTAFNGSLQFDVGDGALGFDSSFVRTERDEDQLTTAFTNDGEVDEIEFEHEDISQESWWVQGFYEQPLGAATLKLDGSYSEFDDDTDVSEGEVDDGEEEVSGLETNRTADEETKLGGEVSWGAGVAHTISVGLDLQRKERDAEQHIFEIDDGETEEETPGSGIYNVEEDRADVYLMDTWTMGDRTKLEYGARGEYTNLDLNGSDGSDSSNDFELNPSVHLLVQATEASQFRVSLARTVRRPDFNQLVPFTDDDSPSDDQTTIGNPELDPETALGLDAGYEYRFTDQFGILGFNVFYRDVEDVIDLVEIGPDLFTPENIDDGTVWGAEFDMSVPLSFIGAPSVGAFANVTWLDSEVTDPFTGEERKFNLQPDYVYNVGFFHDVQSWLLSYGASYQKQGEAPLHEADAVRTIAYDGNLEIFLEKRFANDLVLRFTGSNLLDAKKVESITNYDSLGDLIDGNVDGFEEESEETGPVWSLTVRLPFAR